MTELAVTGTPVSNKRRIAHYVLSAIHYACICRHVLQLYHTFSIIPFRRDASAWSCHASSHAPASRRGCGGRRPPPMCGCRRSGIACNAAPPHDRSFQGQAYGRRRKRTTNQRMWKIDVTLVLHNMPAVKRFWSERARASVTVQGDFRQQGLPGPAAPATSGNLRAGSCPPQSPHLNGYQVCCIVNKCTTKI